MVRKTKNTREEILDVAQDLIQRRGLNAMSFQDLSDAVGIRKASVHHHFASKDEMVNALILRYRQEFKTVVDGIILSNVLGKTKLRRYFDLFLATGQNDKSCLCGMLIAEMFSLDENGLHQVQTFLRDNSEAITQMIDSGIEDGSLSISGNVPATAEMILATLEGGLLLSRCDGGPAKLSGMLSKLLALLTP